MNKIFLRTVVAGLAVLLCAGAAVAQEWFPQWERDEPHKSSAPGDVAGIIAVLTDDHLAMAPDGPTPPDNRALAEWHQARIDQYQFESAFSSDDIQVHGDIAIERWSSDIRLIPRDGGETVEDSSEGV